MMMRWKSRGRLFLKGGGDDTARPMDNASSTPPSPPSGPMTRSRAKAIHDKVNSFLYMCELDPNMDGMLPHANALCILRYESPHCPCGPHEEGHEGSSKMRPEDRRLRPVKTGDSALLTPETPPKTPGKTPASREKLSGILPGVWTGVQTRDSGPTGDSAPSTPETPA